MTTLNVCLRSDRLADGLEAAVESMAAPGTWQSEDGRCLVAVAVSPSGVERGDAPEVARRIGEAYRSAPDRWPSLPDRPVAAVIVDTQRGRALAGVDAAGLHQLYWERDGGRLRVASRLRSLVEGRGARPTLDPQALYDYVYFHCIPSPRTVYAGIHKLPAGHCLSVDRGDARLRRWFEVSFDEHTDRGADELAGELLAELDASVGRAMRPGASEGAFLSGGLDSSTVSGMFAKHLRPKAAPTFSIGFEAQGYDETEYARIAARHFGTEAHEYYVTPEDIHSAVRDIAAAFDEPFGNSSAIPVYFCARLAREHGVERMLAGDGGDELFAGNSRYAKQLVFERYGRVPAALRGGLLEPLLLGTPVGRLPLARKAASYIRQAQVPLPDRLQSYNFLHRHAASEVFAPGLLGRIDTDAPLRALRAEYGEHAAAPAVDRMLFLDWKFTLHDNDLVKVNGMCGLAGVDVGYPMLDESLVRMSCRIPATLKLRDGELRWFYKHATRDFLPGEIIRKKKHGFGLPFGVWLTGHAGLRELATVSLGRLRERGLFDGGFLDGLLAMQRDVHAAYYGELVWVLMVLELWLEAHAPSTAG